MELRTEINKRKLMKSKADKNKINKTRAIPMKKRRQKCPLLGKKDPTDVKGTTNNSIPITLVY